MAVSTNIQPATTMQERIDNLVGINKAAKSAADSAAAMKLDWQFQEEADKYLSEWAKEQKMSTSNRATPVKYLYRIDKKEQKLYASIQKTELFETKSSLISNLLYYLENDSRISVKYDLSAFSVTKCEIFESESFGFGKVTRYTPENAACFVELSFEIVTQNAQQRAKVYKYGKIVSRRSLPEKFAMLFSRKSTDFAVSSRKYGNSGNKKLRERVEKPCGKKVELKLFVNSNGNVQFYYGFVQREKVDKKVVISRQKLGYLDIFPKKSFGFVTDYCGAVIAKYAPIMAYQAIYTIWSKEGTPFLYNLMNQCLSIQSQEANNAYIEYASALYGKNNVQQVLVHNYKVESGKKVEVLPWFELKNTDLGTDLFENQQINEGLDAEDIVQVAQIAMLELVHIGAVQKPSDFFTSANYVYGKVNSYIRSLRHENAISAEKVEIWNENGVFTTIPDKKVEKTLLGVDGSEFLNNFCLFCFENGVKEDKINLFSRLYVLISYGFTKVEIADIFQLSEGMVRKYCIQLRGLLEDFLLGNIYDIFT